eukprot:CAMPEP_0171167304 /NCGR_PEP_ID=MMETSP0790-20130122/7134_1 /TAXON_ID=2925 /ORGANISM="Alexandrium catenella, Strain OF101" /LENGTH=644 /DNA_ID=CAMNT_0011632125 /DNA_START=81 /DNA_END=2015 /DNA_ORIENTATION=-
MIYNIEDDYTALLQTHVGVSSFAGQLANGTRAVQPHLTPAGSGMTLAINSAGEHTGVRKTIDVILLCAALVLPIVMFFVLRVLDKAASSQKQDDKDGREGEGSDRVRRLGSTYQLQGTPGNVSLTSALNRGAEEPDEGTVLENVLAGFSTAMAALPDAISFSFITGVSPLNGIWAGCIMGVSAAMCGGRPGMISSASAATAVVLAHVSLDPNLGMGPMALCVFIVGVLQLIAAALRLSRFITMIPHSVMLGFVNGLAIVMIKAQMRQYHYHGDGPWVERELVISMTITGVFAMAAAWTWARIPVAGKVFPAPLASLILTALFAFALKDIMPRRTLKDVAGAATFRGGFSTMPSWNFPPAGVNWSSGDMWGSVISTAVRFAIVGLLESLMTQALIDQITGTSGSMRRECFGQGVGNILSAFFGTQGGCALIAQSLLNVGSGGRSRVSGLTMGITLGLSVFLLAPVMAQIPVAALVGLIALIALNTFAWSSLMLILRINWIDAVVVVLVTVVTVVEDLCVAVIIGLVINALGFSWSAATRVRVTSESVDGSTRVFRMRGPLFFGSALNYKMEVNPLHILETHVILEFSDSMVLDISGTNAIAETRSNLMDAGKTVTLRGLSAEVIKELPTDAVVEPGISEGKGSFM